MIANRGISGCSAFGWLLVPPRALASRCCRARTNGRHYRKRRRLSTCLLLGSVRRVHVGQKAKGRAVLEPHLVEPLIDLPNIAGHCAASPHPFEGRHCKQAIELLIPLLSLVHLRSRRAVDVARSAVRTRVRMMALV